MEILTSGNEIDVYLTLGLKTNRYTVGFKPTLDVKTGRYKNARIEFGKYLGMSSVEVSLSFYTSVTVTEQSVVFRFSVHGTVSCLIRIHSVLVYERVSCLI